MYYTTPGSVKLWLDVEAIIGSVRSCLLYNAGLKNFEKGPSFVRCFFGTSQSRGALAPEFKDNKK
jgi:hypothetical protein